ncbi:uncharacterized protein CIMG_12929 [Coccidioides immitis RS]|uniref:Uncharacterized protein n=1 Tax=Coccidioides immitis (strain RS) TaxID=246410 RepID=J3K3B2_COCIM|nr:uncharacterized protein CIMG_12929 [Coccidioides immitis RS]EAS28656.3 hypothetical protein CIMG_12929 [Coccidioides immitis RS]
MKVRNIKMLFTWLWSWNGDGNGNWPHKYWKSKQYQVLFHQSFNVIVSVYGTQQACEWWTIVKQIFICSHWILPYSIPSNLDAWLAIEQGQYPVPAAMSPNPEVFLLAAGKESESASQLHTNCKWLTFQLVLHIQALVEAERQQVQSMNLSREKHAQYQRCMQQQLKVAQIEAFYYNQCRTAMKAYQCKAAGRDQTV